MFDSCATSTLHQRVFTAENFYTRSLCTKQFLHQKPLNCTRVLEQEPFTPTRLLTTCPQVNLRFWAVFSIRLTRGYHLISFDIIWYHFKKVIKVILLNDCWNHALFPFIDVKEAASHSTNYSLPRGRGLLLSVNAYIKGWHPKLGSFSKDPFFRA